MAKLSEQEIEQRLTTLEGWQYKDKALSRMFRFKEFMDGIKAVNQVAEKAEAADHHPDIGLNWVRVTFTCTTHDAGGVTEKDFRLAQEIDRVAKAIIG